MFAAVYVGRKLHSLFGDFIQFGKRKHLKSAAVRKDRAIPVHKFMQSARFFHDLVAGAHV